MDSNKIPYESRLYSAARVKRRENLIKNKKNTSDPKLPESEIKVHFKLNTDNHDTDNKTDGPGTHSKASPRLVAPKQSEAEKNLSAKNNFCEDLSDSTSDSFDSGMRSSTTEIAELHSNSDSQKLKILTTLLPDELLRNPKSQSPRFYQTALMFPDVSGFTHLCEKYDKTGMGGPSRLTEVLNGFIGSMVDIVLSKNGDVLKFGGDAFLCAWKSTEDLDISEVVHIAIESAVDIQKHCGEHKTDVGVKLRVKIAVSAGKVLFSVIGNRARKNYVIVGPPVMEVRDAEQISRPGDVIVTPSAWMHVKNYMFYSFTYHSDNRHIKVHDFGPLWKSGRAASKFKDTGLQLTGLRPFLKHTSRLSVDDLRPFILPPVMRSIDLNRPLDYLTEMRQVAIVFFNVAANFYTMPSTEIAELCNKAIQIVTEIVFKSGGATNKLTLFDKDLAILTVFGLKGFKHEFASQVALKCAYNCLEQLIKLEINSASAGVTTGMTYCGVIGHTLRKEYTVMGHPVNLAARLMCAYHNIVSCDRNTFLHSKLESHYFELLEYEFMKGIQNAGPFYKFNLRPKRPKLKLDHEAYPILGRGKEIKEFESFLKNGVTGDCIENFLIIFGKARIGKSRLLAKLINVAEKLNLEELKYNLQVTTKDDHLEIRFIPLTEDDSKVAYATIRFIFQSVLGLRDSASKDEKQDKILLKLGEMKEYYLLAVFNTIFNVSFPLMPQYLILTPAEQVRAQTTMVKELYRKCFPKDEKYLIAIDDAEFMDEESWEILKLCSNEAKTVLYLLTIGQRKSLSPAALSCLDFVSAKKIALTEIDKWYYSGLACQILEVKAIPVELENLLHSSSNSGNPGWLESFLLSLKQSGSIYIGQTSVQNMKTLGLVAVPEFMLKADKVTDESERREITQWDDCLETLELYGIDENNYNVPVCFLGTNFFAKNETEADLTMDDMFIKTIDTLKPLEQLVLKVGSVLGYNLKRSALMYIISKESSLEEKTLARVIKNLFEIKILTCAKGNLGHSNLLMPKRMLLVTSIRKDITCECIGLEIPKECRKLPKYANCGYMQFKSSVFRDTVYNLLLDDQKKKFHYYYIEFLRKNTLKCTICGSLPFPKVLGYEVNDQMTLACTVTPMHGVRSTQLESNLLESFKTSSRSSNRNNSDVKIESTLAKHALISVKDKGDCECLKILSSLYSVLQEHAAGAGRNDIMLEVQLEYASVSLTDHNIPLTLMILGEALNLVNKMKENNEHPELCTPYIYGKIYTLMGTTKLNTGSLNESLELFKNALKYLKKNLPESKFAMNLLTRNETVKLKMKTELMPEKFIGKISKKKAFFTDLLSECLGMTSVVYTYMENWLLAKYTSIWALNTALESNRNFFGLCNAYCIMIYVAYRNGNLESCDRLEICAISLCSRCNQEIIESFEWEIICRLYVVICFTRHMRAEIEDAVVIGFQSIKIASMLRNTSLKLFVMPDLIFALMQLNRLSEALALLQELEFISQLDSDKSSRLWYYTLCLNFHLYTGYTVVPFETCEDFVREGDIMLRVRDPDAKYRLYTSLWLWCVRNNEWELSKSYSKVLENYKLIERGETPCNIFMYLQKLEALLITLVHKMDQRNIYSINTTYSEVHRVMNHLKKELKVVKLFQPRYYILKAYYKQIRHRDDSYKNLLTQAHNQAEKIKDVNASLWISHLKMVWSNAISVIHRDYWIEHSRQNTLEWHETQQVNQKQSILYSLPLPKF